MGFSLRSALIGSGMVILSEMLPVIWKRREAAGLLVVAGLALNVLPYGLLYLFLD